MNTTPRRPLAVALLLAATGCEPDDDDTGGPDLITGPREVCYGVTLDVIPGSVQETNFVLDPRRHYDREPLCWTFDQRFGDTPDVVEFTLTRTFSVTDGHRYGCRFSGSGNALRATIDEGACLIEQEGGHLRMTLSEPGEVQIQNIHNSLVVLEFELEEARVGWTRTRGTARLSMANQDSVLQGLDRGEADLDSTGPDPDPWGACPAAPVCLDVDLTGSATLVEDTDGDPVCEAWIADLQYGALRHRIDEDWRIDWQDQGTTLYHAVRAADRCALLGYAGSMDTRNDYIVDLDGETFTMALRAYHQESIDGVPRTAYCHGEWTGPAEVVPCSP